MFCQKCGKENSDGAAFCNSCGVSFTKKSVPNTAYLQTKENEIRLLQEKFNRESSNIWPIVLGFTGAFIGGCVMALTSPLIGLFVVGTFVAGANAWRSSKSEAAKKTKIKLNAAKAELETMENA